MRSAWKRIIWSGPLFLGLLPGCWTTHQQLRPERPPEEFALPPKDDSRFDQYVTYPKNVMGNDRIKAEQEKDSAVMQGMPKQSSRPGTITPTGF